MAPIGAKFDGCGISRLNAAKRMSNVMVEIRSDMFFSCFVLFKNYKLPVFHLFSDGLYKPGIPFC